MATSVLITDLVPISTLAPGDWFVEGGLAYMVVDITGIGVAIPGAVYFTRVQEGGTIGQLDGSTMVDKATTVDISMFI